MTCWGREWEIVNAIEAQHWRGVELLVPPTHPLPCIQYSPAHGAPTPLGTIYYCCAAGGEYLADGEQKSGKGSP